MVDGECLRTIDILNAFVNIVKCSCNSDLLFFVLFTINGDNNNTLYQICYYENQYTVQNESPIIFPGYLFNI